MSHLPKRLLFISAVWETRRLSVKDTDPALGGADHSLWRDRARMNLLREPKVT